jgi:hypothetical protein
MNLPAWMVALIVVGTVGLLALIYLVSLYNNLVTLRNRFKNAFAQIDVQLKLRVQSSEQLKSNYSNAKATNAFSRN